jgi:hypothetical protein
MRTNLKQQPTNVPLEHRPTTDLLKLICKLRWLGLEAEAEVVQLRMARGEPTNSVLATPQDTD